MALLVEDGEQNFSSTKKLEESVCVYKFKFRIKLLIKGIISYEMCVRTSISILSICRFVRPSSFQNDKVCTNPIRA